VPSTVLSAFGLAAALSVLLSADNLIQNERVRDVPMIRA
jgi:hypothetical protein